MSTICVIGGTGFVGSHLLKLLEGNRGYRVKVLSRKPADQFAHLTNGEVTVGDLLNADSLPRFLEPGAVVVNLAYMPSRSSQDNLRATFNLANACLTVGIERLIHVSTAVVVGRTGVNLVTETTMCEPFTEYEKTRLEIEQVLLERLSSYCRVAIVRPTEVFGENGKGLIRLATELVEGSGLVHRLKLSLNSRRRLHLVYVENVASAIRHLIYTDQDIHRQCYIMSEDDVAENNYSDVVRLMTDYLGVNRTTNVHFTYPPWVLAAALWMAGRSDTNPFRTYSCQKILQLGFRRPVSFQDGLRRFADWYKRTHSLPA